MDMGQTSHRQLTRIGVFYDGGYFSHVSNYYRYDHERGQRISIHGLHEFIREEVGHFEQTNPQHCHIVEAHYFRGRFSAEEAQERDMLLGERQFEDALMKAGVTTHFLPVSNRGADEPKEKGVDVWLALEAFELAMHKGFDVVTLISGDGDYVPLVRKLNALGIRVMVTAWDFDLPDGRSGTRTSQALIDQVTYPVMMDAIINDRGRRNTIEKLFVTPRSALVPPQPRPPAQSISAVAQTENGERLVGVIGSMPLHRDFGFVAPEQGEENLFFHQTWVENCSFHELRPGDRVEYTPDVNPNTGRPVAMRIVRL